MTSEMFYRVHNVEEFKYVTGMISHDHAYILLILSATISIFINFLVMMMRSKNLGRVIQQLMLCIQTLGLAPASVQSKTTTKGTYISPE